MPEIFLCQIDIDNILGAQYMLMERMEGEQLEDVWDTLDLSAKKSIIKEMAKFLVSLSELKFDKIGCYRHDCNDVGPFLDTLTNEFVGPLFSALQYFKLHLPPELDKSSKSA